MVYTIVTYICLAGLVYWVLSLACKLFSLKRNRVERLRYIRSFKKGTFTIPLIPAFFLYLIGKTYARGFSLIVIMESVATTISLMGLRCETDSVLALMKASEIYSFSLHLCFVLVFLNACMLTNSILQQRFHFWRRSARKRSRRIYEDNVCFIYGNNARSLKMYETDGDDYCPAKFIVDDFLPAGDEELFFKDIAYAKCLSFEEEAKAVGDYLKSKEEAIRKEKAILKNDTDKTRLFLEEKRKNQKDFIIIVNFEDDDKNIDLCRRLSQIVGEVHARHAEDDTELNYLLNSLNIYVFGNDELDSIYQEIEARTFGCIHFVNKYKTIGMNVLMRYPVTSFLNENQIDYSKAALESDVRISFSMIGFGKANRRLFSDLVSDTQFHISDGKGGYKAYTPAFYLYDKNNNIYTKDLNHNYFRYEEFLKAHASNDGYLPFAPLPADVNIVSDCDINSPDFYASLRTSLGEGSNDVNFVYISYGSDLQNIELAKKLYDKKNEWNIRNLHIFVKVSSLANATTEYLLDEDKECFKVYGEDEEVYSFRNVISPEIYRLASYCDGIYEIVSGKANPRETRVEEIQLSRKWFNSKKYEFDRMSSLAQGISIVNKLGMLGLEICDGSDGISSDIYDSLYTNNEAVRKNLTESEHQRWNAFMICNGYIPSTKEQILRYNPKNPEQNRKKKEEEHKERRHANLTTFEGLDLFKEMLAEEFNAENPDVYDVAKYDSYLMDNCYKVVERLGKGLRRK